MTTFPFKIITPDGIFVSGEVTQIKLNSYEGALGIMAKHVPMVVACPPGFAEICQDNQWIKIKTSKLLVHCNGSSVELLTTYAQLSV